MLLPRLFLLLSFAAAGLAFAQQRSSSPPPGVPDPAGDEATANEPKTSYQAVNASIDSVLQQYEMLTGKILIRDSNLTANALPLTISVPTPVPRAELARLIEASLLLNNYALIPASEPNTMKVINVNTGKNPRSEGVQLYAGPEGLPEADQVVSYYMPFRYVSANEALTVFQTHVLPRAYTAFVPVNSSQALIITESTSVIRQLITLQQLIDVPPTRTVAEFVHLVRADAERVAETLNKLLGTETVRPASVAPGPQQAAAAAPITNPEGGLLGSNAQLIPDTRTNRILIVCRPHNLAYLRKLVVEFDQAAVSFRPLEYRLRYVSAGEVLPVLADLLSEEQKTGQAGQPSQQLQQNQPPGGQNRGVNLFGGTSGSTFAGGYNPTGGSAGSVGAGQDLLQEPNEQLGPQAVIVGKTRIISDSKDNKILVIGPPESLSKVEAILTRLDRRPQQVYLATVIGQVQLTKDFEFGVDFAQVYRHIRGEGTGVASSNVNTSAVSNGNTLVEPTQLNTVGSLVTNTVGGAASGLAIYGKISDALAVLIKALDNRGSFKVLARPAIYTANNKRAVISSGQRVPVPESTLSNVNTSTVTSATQTAAVSATITYEDVELRLEVIPLINSNGEVTLKIAQINDSLGNNVVISGNSVPEVNSQRLTTTVTIPSGATVVLGGLIQETIQKTDNGIPYLDRVPYLGNLLKTHGEHKTRSELLVFIQPTVVNDDVETLRASMKEERRTHVGQDTYDLAHPSDYAASPIEEPTPKRNQRGKY
jgi:general secretion pathway protein D